MTEDLYTTKDVTRVRLHLLSEQQNKDACTGLIIPDKTSALDHAHNEEQYVRAVLHRQVNTAIGKIENLYIRMLAWWYPYDLPTFLDSVAAYIRHSNSKDKDVRWRHVGWIKRVKTLFNKLNARQQDEVLLQLGSSKGKNQVERKNLFAVVVLDRSLGFKRIVEVITNVSK